MAELRLIGEVLQLAPAAVPEVRARRCHPVGRWSDNRPNYPTRERTRDLGNFNLCGITGAPQQDKDGQAFMPPDCFAADGQGLKLQDKTITGVKKGGRVVAHTSYFIRRAPARSLREERAGSGANRIQIADSRGGVP